MYLNKIYSLCCFSRNKNKNKNKNKYIINYNQYNNTDTYTDSDTDTVIDNTNTEFKIKTNKVKKKCIIKDCNKFIFSDAFYNIYENSGPDAAIAKLS